jgi:glycine/D-amino acid oxidase-like deaminating enzyme
MSLTPRRDLRTGMSVWESGPPISVPFVALAHDITTDIVVVGTGISGAMVAEALSDAGLRVAIVDRRRPVTGSTPASTALILYELDLPLSLLGERLGPSRAARVWQRSRLAVGALRERARHLGIDAGCTDRDSLYLDGNVLCAEGLARECQARRGAGFEATFLDPSEVERRFGIAGRAGVLSYDNLAADPRRLTAGFLRAAVSRGARIFSPVDVAAVEAGASGVVAHTVSGPAIRARHLVFATGYELPEGVPRKGHGVVSTWAIATRPQSGRLWPECCFVWEASDPYLYIRTSPGGRVICGGGDEIIADAAARDALLAAKTRLLEARLSALFPRLDSRARYAWCGTFGDSVSGTPSIGAVPGMASCFAVLGYGGNGITFSALAAQLLRNQITGADDPDGELFAFS